MADLTHNFIANNLFKSASIYFFTVLTVLTLYFSNYLLTSWGGIFYNDAHLLGTSSGELAASSPSERWS